jgi:hypothetical protein
VRSLRKNHSGIISIWVVCFVGLFLYSVVWFVLAWATFDIAERMTSTFQFPAQATLTINFIKTVLQWHPVFALFGFLLWSWAAAQTHERTEPVGYL